MAERTSKGWAFTDADVATIEALIVDRCPPGEIAKTVGCTAHALITRWPAARMTRAERSEWASICAKIGHDSGDYPRAGRSRISA
ncbi:hypothetical protein [Gordonia sp. (in: high G+C Gram-positive bacteria)]|uniref:hypothetical protein n=1 Tax=Gordonia sp. (in: high G+C Gram-positive bacteria) TaxID=84139 RepID=UPI00333F9884